MNPRGSDPDVGSECWVPLLVLRMDCRQRLGSQILGCQAHHRGPKRGCGLLSLHHDLQTQCRPDKSENQQPVGRIQRAVGGIRRAVRGWDSASGGWDWASGRWDPVSGGWDLVGGGGDPTSTLRVECGISSRRCWCNSPAGHKCRQMPSAPAPASGARPRKKRRQQCRQC